MKRDQGIELERAREMALALVELLRPACERVEIAGSIRRLKPRPNDIEIVAIPVFRETPHAHEVMDFFTTLSQGSPPGKPINELDALCRDLLRLATLEKRPDKNGRFCWGERIKRAVYYHQEEGWGDAYAPLDLFACIEPAQWGVIYAIRTGPGDFNRLLVTSQRYGGACPLDRKVAGGEVWDFHFASPDQQRAYAAMPATKFAKLARRDEIQAFPIETSREEGFFGVLHVPCWPPEERTIARLQAFLRQKEKKR